MFLFLFRHDGMLLCENGGSLVLQTKDRSVACIIQQKCLVQHLVCEIIRLGWGNMGAQVQHHELVAGVCQLDRSAAI